MRLGETRAGARRGAPSDEHTAPALIKSTRRGEAGFVRDRLIGVKGVLLVADIATLVIAFVVWSWLRLGPEWTASWDRALPEWRTVVPAYCTAAVFAGWALGAYRIHPGWALQQEFRRALLLVGGFAVVTIAALFLFDRDNVSRLFLVGFFEIAFLGFVGARLAVRGVFRRLREAGRGLAHVLVVGTGPTAEHFVGEVTAHQEAGVQIVGYVAASDDEPLEGYARIGGLGDIPALLASEVVDEVVICLPLQQWRLINTIAQEAELQGKVVRIPIWMVEGVRSRGRLDDLAGMPVLSLVSTSGRAMSLAVKRAIDLAAAVGGLLLASPLLVLAAIAVRLEDGGPVLFRQERIGLHGRRFTALKLRSMVVDAERRLDELVDRNERHGPVFKLRDDPRVTRVGRWLRRTSVDELPQLWNVLKGDMSLVGPRPPLPSEVERYDPWHRRRLSMKPGLTGLWQISARSEADFNRWVELDLEYIDTWSLWNDLVILARTVPAVLRMTGN